MFGAVVYGIVYAFYHLFAGRSLPGFVFVLPSYVWVILPSTLGFFEDFGVGVINGVSHGGYDIGCWRPRGWCVMLSCVSLFWFRSHCGRFVWCGYFVFPINAGFLHVCWVCLGLPGLPGCWF